MATRHKGEGRKWTTKIEVKRAMTMAKDAREGLQARMRKMQGLG